MDNKGYPADSSPAQPPPAYPQGQGYQQPAPGPYPAAAPPPMQGYNPPPAASQPYPPQQYGQPVGVGYPPPPPGPTVVVAAGTLAVGRNPENLTCPVCKAQVQTDVKYKIGSGTWIAVAAIFGIGCIGGLIFALPIVLLLCCCIPCCLKDCKDAIHECPNCKAFIGTRPPKYIQ